MGPRGLVFATVLAGASAASRPAFYVPGEAPRAWAVGEGVDVFVDSLESTQTQLPYSYYQFPFCAPPKRPRAQSETLGERLQGSYIQSSPYALAMQQDAGCAMVCAKELSVANARKFRRLIDKGYRVHMLADGLPAVVNHQVDDQAFVTRGYPVGFATPEDAGAIGTGGARHFLFNHLRFRIFYHEAPASYAGARIVGFEVEPVSVDHDRRRRGDPLAYGSRETYDATVAAAAAVGANVVLGATGPEEWENLEEADEDESEEATGTEEPAEMIPRTVLPPMDDAGSVPMGGPLLDLVLQATAQNGEPPGSPGIPASTTEALDPGKEAASATTLEVLQSTTEAAAKELALAQIMQTHLARVGEGALPAMAAAAVPVVPVAATGEGHMARTLAVPTGYAPEASVAATTLPAAGLPALAVTPAVAVTPVETTTPVIADAHAPVLPAGELAAARGTEDLPVEAPHPSLADFSSVGRRLQGPSCSLGSPVNDPRFFLLLDVGDSTGVADPGSVEFSYEVAFLRSETIWADRWDLYLNYEPADEIHWFSIMNSTLIVVFLTAVVAVILERVLRRDIAEYNREKTSAEERQEETGWKLVHGDVFRPPTTYPMLLSVCAGTGAQVLLMAFAVVFMGLAGFLNPANKGGTLMAVIGFFVLSGTVAGYFSALTYKLVKGKDWRRNMFLTATLYPGVVSSLFVVLDMFLWGDNAASAIGWSTALVLLALWLFVAAPLVCVGSWVGFRRKAVEIPVKITLIPRVIPEVPSLASLASVSTWYAHPVLGCMLAGVLPFGAICIELFSILSAMWLHQYFFVFGFLVAVLLILVLTSAEIAVVMVYFMLCKEDYRWWWRSFLSCASSGAYVFLYALWYFFAKLDIQAPLPTLVYFTYMAIISLTFAIMTGSIGFYACLGFVLRIYSEVKTD